MVLGLVLRMNSQKTRNISQDSVMYRSFVTCDDPKGVVECGKKIRKYRTCSQKMKDKIKVQKTAESLESSFINTRHKEEKVPKGSIEKLYNSSSLQVSRGDQSLNNMIDSWSSDLMYDGRSEDIAKDLLKGAIDLQDSLVMLCKLQEASQHMAHLKRKQTEKPRRDRIDAKMIGRTHANQFSEQSHPMRFQRPQPSVNGSSSNCTEELKKVIKESLVGQNLFPNTTIERLDSASEITSTSPSQSSGVWTDRLSDPSFSLRASKMKRGPNLVAKLMGLEEAPSRSYAAVMQKQLDGEKILNQKRSIFEIDMPKVRKNDSIVEKVNPERKTLRETLETMHFKGLLKKSSFKEPKLQVHHFNGPHSRQFDDLSHIVLMKPRCTPYQESVKPHLPVPPEELSLGKLKAEVISSKTIKHRKGSSSTDIEKEMEIDVSKRLTKEEGPKFLKEVVKLNAKGINPIQNEKFSGKVKLYCHVCHTSQVNETTDKKCKVQTISRKLPEKDISEPRIVATPQDQREITSTKLRKQQSGSRIDQNEISCLKSTASNTISISKKETHKINNSKYLGMEIKESDSVVDSLTHRKNQMKNQSPVAEPEAARTIAEQIGLGEEKKSINVPCKDNYTEIRMATTLAVELLMGCEADASANKIGEECKLSKSSSGDDIMLLKSEHENDSIPAEEAHESTNCSETKSKHDKERAELKRFLLTNQSFIGHAEELFNLDVDCPKILQKDENNGIANLRLYLDCANELTELKSLQESQVVRSFLLTCAGNSRLHISLGRLVEEIYNAIENLKCYSENSGEKLFVDNLFAMMEKDIKCNGLINGMWEWGWRHGFSANEAEIVVNEVGSMLVSGLIEEVIINL